MIVTPDRAPRITTPGCRVNDSGLPKRAFRSSREAKRAAEHMRSRGVTEPLSTYRCPSCASWHIGRHMSRWRA